MSNPKSFLWNTRTRETHSHREAGKSKDLEARKIMKLKMWTPLAAAMIMLLAASAMAGGAQPDIARDESDTGKMFHKLGRGLVNGLTCWVEIPRNIAIEWERTDPVTGIGLGTVKGVGYGFARFATGVYETFTFPFPIPADYASMIEPEFVITDVWGDPIPGLGEKDDSQPLGSDDRKSYPQQFRF